MCNLPANVFQTAWTASFVRAAWTTVTVVAIVTSYPGAAMGYVKTAGWKMIARSVNIVLLTNHYQCFLWMQNTKYNLKIKLPGNHSPITLSHSTWQNNLMASLEIMRYLSIRPLRPVCQPFVLLRSRFLKGNLEQLYPGFKWQNKMMRIFDAVKVAGSIQLKFAATMPYTS